MSEATLETAIELGLLKEEYEQILNIMGRTPNFNEISIYSVMWSEHCSYKNSIKYLKTLPRSGPGLLAEAGSENAGLIDIGDGLACAFKIESHNHPSAVEPYQGAATGVGGIHRDIFTMGARPLAAFNSLRFGVPDNKHMQRLIKGVVHGIGDYGNCLGIPTIGGETFFHPSYNQNILVNAMSVGLVKIGETMSAIAEGEGNKVFIVGAATGKDGIHGATFASADLHEDSAEDLPSVQVGDPFLEKLLLEASLEAIQSGALVGMQDMGAAGIICSTSEMSAKGGVGMTINLDAVPRRQKNMQPFELLLSESQERMLIVCHKGQEQKIVEIFEKWDLPCVEIGEVTNTGQLEFYAAGVKVADVNAESLVLGGGAPVYSRDFSRPKYLEQNSLFKIDDIPEPSDIVATARQLITSPNLLSKKWITEQYDSMVRTNTIDGGSFTDASVIRIKGTNKGIAASTDCNSTYVYADPFIGSQIAVYEAARNIVCTGGRPVAITNCLNFGNPYNPEVYYQFVKTIEGMGQACRSLQTPVTGGNVSFYNQTMLDSGTEPIYPTPTIGMVGIIDDMSNLTDINFKTENDIIILVGRNRNDINSSEYLRYIHQVNSSPAPYFDQTEELLVQKAIHDLIRAGLLRSAHDISEGGLFQNLLESCYANKKSFEISISDNIRLDALLFGECQSRIVISIDPEHFEKVQSIISELNVNYEVLGKVTQSDILINKINFGTLDLYQQIFINRLEAIIYN